MVFYKVWNTTPRYFADLNEAIAYAENYRRKTGIFLAITEYAPRRKTKKA